MPCPFIIIAKLVCKEKKKNYNKSHVITSIKFVKICENFMMKGYEKGSSTNQTTQEKINKRKESKASRRNTQCGRMSS
jgi:hypothetical protein